MAHGNKKFFFEELKKKGDSITAKCKNIYSLNNQISLYKKVSDPQLEVAIEAINDEEFRITRTSHKTQLTA